MDLLLFISFLLFGRIISFDLQNPVVFQGVRDKGFFGFSSAFVNVNTPRGRNSWIFIGDPIGNLSSDPSYQNVLQPGVVWRCSLHPRSGRTPNTKLPECETLNIDPIRYAECRDQCPIGAPRFENHRMNWVGGTIVSSASRLVIGAHRWRRGPEAQRAVDASSPVVNGLAYWFDTERMFDGNNRLNIGPSNKLLHRLIPLYFPPEPYTAMPRQYFINNIGLNLPDYAHGEAGFSMHLRQEEDSEGSAELIMGAPGIRVWRGGVIRYRDHSNDIYATRRLNSDNRQEFDRYRIGKRYHGGGNEYFGYAVVSGNFFRRRSQNGENIFYAGGAPRAHDLKGEVTIFQFPDNTPQTEFIYHQLIIRGEQFGSYFGSVLAAADLNRDGTDELLIGAPYFNEPITSTGDVFLDHGTVFLYSDSLQTDSKDLSSQSLIRITSGSQNKRGGRFGAAIVKLGDIDEDNFEDFAIGAPFEDEKGAVYIYKGKEYLHAEWRPYLRISAIGNDFSPLRFQGLGSSFSTPLDIDLNYTPDIAIGSYLSQSIMILRSRPVLDFETNITYFASAPNARIPIQIRQLATNVKNFQIQTCVRLIGKALAATRTKLKLDITFSIDVLQAQPRFSFVLEDGTQITENRIYFQLDADPLNAVCRKLQAKADIEVDDKSPSIEPIYFDQTIEYKGIKTSEENGPVVFNIQNGRVQPSGKDSFGPLTPLPFTKSITPPELNINSDCKDVSHCVPDLQINAWWADDSGGNSVKISKIKLDWRKKGLSIHVRLSNRGEPAYSPEVYFVVKSAKKPRIDFLSSANLISVCQGGDLKETRKDFTYRFHCSLFKPLRGGDEPELIVPFDLSGIYANGKSDELIIGISVSAKGDASSKREHKDIILVMESDVGIKMIGSVTPIKEPVSVHSPFNQQYEVILNGVTPIDNLFFNFKFPAGKSEASVLSLRHPTGNKIQCTSTGIFADFKRDDSPTSSSSTTEDMNVVASRRRREVNQIGHSKLHEVERIKPNENMTVFSCDDGNQVNVEECVNIDCRIYEVNPLHPLELITFTMQLSPKKTAGILAGKQILLLESLGTVEIFKKTIKADGVAQTVVKFHEVGIAVKIPIWVYIVSGIGGLLILILIIFGLYKMGFFRRATKEQLQERKAEVQEAIRRASMMEYQNNDVEHEVHDQEHQK